MSGHEVVVAHLRVVRIKSQGNLSTELQTTTEEFNLKDNMKYVKLDEQTLSIEIYIDIN